MSEKERNAFAAVMTGANDLVSAAEYQRHVLRSLLHYHERMMLGNRKCTAGHCDAADQCDALKGECPKVVFLDGYADALREAIRCIEIVHKDELVFD